MLKLVYLCLFFIYGSQGLDEDLQALIDNLHNTCVDEVGVAENLIKDAQNGNFAEDPKLKCYIKCLMDQMAVADDNGVLDGEAAVALLPPEYAEKAEKPILKCQHSRGSDPCDTTFQSFKCWFKEGPDSYFLP